MASISVGSVSVDVVPSTETFAAKLKAQLRDLNIKLDIDTAQASVKIDEIRAKLDELTGHASVNLDTGAADVKIAALKAELDSVRDKKINVDDNGSSGNVASKILGIANAASFAQAGVAAKTVGIITAIAAIIPIAAAATAAVAGIGLGVGLLAAGALVGALALGGVGSAFSAGTTPGAGGQAAQQHAQALDSQRQAEIALTVAQRNAVQAQKDLTQARIDAIQTLQDLSNQVTDNGLAQRQAILDLQTAQQNLKVADASPDAQNPLNANALARVQLAFDQAKQNVTELQQKGVQLSAQQATANALGVNGAANVVAAQNSVVDSQNALVEAQFQVTNSAAQAAAATSAYGAALAKLDPVQQAFTQFLESIKPILDTLKSAAANSFLPLLEQAIKDVLPIIGPLSEVLKTVGTGFGDLAVQAAKFFASPVFTQFLTFLDQFLGPAIAQFGQIFGNLFTAGIAGFEKISPILTEFGNIFVTLTGDIAKSFQGGGLDTFIANIQANLPQLGATLSSVFGAVSSILASLAPSAGPALQIIQQLADGIAQLAPVLGPLITLFLQLVNTAFKPLIPQLVQIVTRLVPPLQGFLAAIVPVAGQLVSAFLDLVSALTPLIPVITQLITALLPPLVSFIDALVNQGIAPLVVGLIEGLAPVLPQIAASFQQLVTALTPLIPIFATALVKAILALAPELPGLAKAFADLVTAFSNLVQNLPPSFMTAFGNLLDFLASPQLNQGAILLATALTDMLIALTAVVNGDFVKKLEPLITAFLTLYNSAIKPIVDGIDKIAHFNPSSIAGSILSGLTGGLLGHATGGAVQAGVPSVVGEWGPELFVPSVDGSIKTNQESRDILSGSGGDTTVNVYEAFNAQATAATVGRRLQFARA